MRLKQCPHCGGDLEDYDGRRTKYRVRARLYNVKNMDEPREDSDEGKHPGAPGEAVLNGFPAIIEAVQYLAQTYHATPMLRGLDTETMKLSSASFRPTLSRSSQTRSKGCGTWRVWYDTPDTWTEKPDHAPGWLVRIDIERLGT